MDQSMEQHQELSNIAYSDLNDMELNEIKEFEQRFNSKHNKDVYLLAFNKEK